MEMRARECERRKKRMDIGTKMKKARVDVGLTQEQVADELGISRQTMSNWENNRTYPDIVSVIKMSDLYKVSLDYLLKGNEETKMTSYLEYLEESTNTVKSKNNLSKIIMLASYLCIWAVTLIEFWIIMDPADAMGYSIMHLWIVLPITTLVVSIVIAKNGYWGRRKWVSSLILGAMYMLAGYSTFSLANMLSFDKFNMPDLGMFAIGVIISVTGLVIGTLAGQKKKISDK